MLTGPKVVTNSQWKDYSAKRIPALMRDEGHGFREALDIAIEEYRRIKVKKANPYRFKLAGRDEMGKCSYVVVRICSRSGIVPVGTYECDGLSWVYEGLDGEYWVGCSSEVHANRAKTKLIRHLLGLGVC